MTCDFRLAVRLWFFFFCSLIVWMVELPRNFDYSSRFLVRRAALGGWSMSLRALRAVVPRRARRLRRR